MKIETTWAHVSFIKCNNVENRKTTNKYTQRGEKIYTSGDVNRGKNH